MQAKQLQIVNFEQAEKLKSKEIGFDWETPYFNKKGELSGLYLPTVALALKWFRDVKGMHGYIKYWSGFGWAYYGSSYVDKVKPTLYLTYDEAESALLDALIEHCLKEVQD